MKIKIWFPTALTIGALCLISWGYTGHRTIGIITENHLTPKAKATIKDLLGDTAIADACTWADDARREPSLANTANWHFVNLPAGLSYQQLKKFLDTTTTANVYSALLDAEKKLVNTANTRQEKIRALKFLMHFVGDLHQPMHVGRAADKGGNTIQLNYNGKGTNLHSLWDTKLLESQGLQYNQLGEKYKSIDEKTVQKWQSAPIIDWVWESYQISNALYAEVDGMSKRTIDDTYVKKHLPTVERRLQQSAVRLAGMLNKVFR